MAGKNNAKLFDPALFIQMGLDPKTRLPLKFTEAGSGSFKPHNLLLLHEVDRADALNRFTWHNLPNGLTGELIERILYYRGQGAFFYMKENDKFYFLPYTLAAPDSGSGLDCYGRYTTITPLMFGGSFDDEPKPFIRGLIKKPVYDIKITTLTLEDIEDGCVLLHDRSVAGISQTVTPRSSLQAPLLDLMSDIPCYLRTSLKNQTGVQGMRVPTEDNQLDVYAANTALNKATLEGDWAVPIVGELEFQQLTGQPTAQSQEYLLTMQALDSYRLSMYGLPNGGLFQKRSNMLESEHNMNTGTAALVLQDDLRQRQTFCDIVNSIFGLGIYVDINETITQIDRDGDGDMYANEPQMPSHESTDEGEEATEE